MDRKEIIELAKKNGMVDFIPVGSNALWEQIEKFVTIAIKHEREACAEEAECIEAWYDDSRGIAKAIRARSSATSRGEE